MKRNMELIRNILLAAETESDLSTIAEIFGCPPDELACHIDLMMEAGYIRFCHQKSVEKINGLSAFVPEMINPVVQDGKIQLTWEGYNLIDTFRDDIVWDKARNMYCQMVRHVAESRASEDLPFRTMLSLCDMILRKQLKYAVDHD